MCFRELTNPLGWFGSGGGGAGLGVLLSVAKQGSGELLSWRMKGERAVRGASKASASMRTANEVSRERSEQGLQRRGRCAVAVR
jgi:hypothetical protein